MLEVYSNLSEEALETTGKAVLKAWRATDNLSQRQLEFLTKTLKISPLSLAYDAGFKDYAVTADRVIVDGKRFRCAASPEEGQCAVIIVVRSGAGVSDLVAWQPREGWTASMFGRVGVLGEHLLSGAWGRDPIRVFSTPRGWMQANRIGIVIVDARIASGILFNSICRYSVPNVETAQMLGEVLNRACCMDRIVISDDDGATS